MIRATVCTAAMLAALATPAFAQQLEGNVPTQVLLRADSKSDAVPTIQNTTLRLDNQAAAITALTPVRPSGTQVAILIDDGLRRSSGLQLNDLKSFINQLPPATEVLVGYMSYGRVTSAQGFTTDHQAVADSIRVVNGIPGESASPYFCLSDFVKHWPGNDSRDLVTAGSGGKARFVLMITDGVDPYNGSDSILNQDSPYVQQAIADAQRAGVQVSAIYYGDAGIRGRRANFSGQDYLTQLTQATGGENLYQGVIEPVSFAPFLKQFSREIAETYVATFDANVEKAGRDHLLQLKVNTTSHDLKLKHPDEVRPGNREGQPAGAAE